MDLKLIRGKTYYMDLAGSAVGIYVFDNGNCLLIDSGDRASNASLILETIRQNDLTVQGIINTHAHADHCAGNCRIQEATNCDIYASTIESYAINEPMIGLYCLYSANPIRMLKNRFLLAEPSRVNHTVMPGDLLINGGSFQILDLKGHSTGQIGVVTPDGVAFVGDSLIDPNILKNFNFLYIGNVEDQFQTLDNLKQNAKTVFLTHGGIVQNVEYAIKQNEDLLKHIAEFIKNLLVLALTREQIVQLTANEFNLPLNRTQYFLASSSVSAFLSYLSNRKEIRCYIENNLLKFVKA